MPSHIGQFPLLDLHHATSVETPMKVFLALALVSLLALPACVYSGGGHGRGYYADHGRGHHSDHRNFNDRRDHRGRR